MKHNNTESLSGSTESIFNEFVQRGDDFFKIELLRQSKKWYHKALIIKLENEKVKFQISECERLLAFENKVVYILISIASVLAVAFYILFD